MVTGEELIIADVSDGTTGPGDFETEGSGGVVSGFPLDLEAIDGDGGTFEHLEVDFGAHILELNGEIIAIELSAEDGFEIFSEPCGPVDGDFVTWDVERGEEGEALDMIPVRVSDEEIDFAWA